jgi:hypothetical protein
MLKMVSFINVYSNLVLFLDDPMIDEQIGKREDVHLIRLEHDTNVPKSVIQEVIITCKSKKDRGYNSQKKDDKQKPMVTTITQKTAA